jgi:hypothetical protein
MNKTPAATAGVSVHGSERDTSTKPRPIIQARPGMAYRKSYRLGRGYSVEFALDGLSLTAEWSPKLPHHKIGRKLLPAYRAARNEFLGSLGVPMLVVDL